MVKSPGERVGIDEMGWGVWGEGGGGEGKDSRSEGVWTTSSSHYDFLCRQLRTHFPPDAKALLHQLRTKPAVCNPKAQ